MALAAMPRLRLKLIDGRQNGATMIDIYTDGSSLGNPGPGGWAAVVVGDGAKRSVHGRHDRTTNNRMEILAVIEGLKAVPKSSEVMVHSDSQYVVNTMTRNWKRNANRDLWERLDAELAGRTVGWRWVPAHVGVPLNEEADRLANREAHGGNQGAGEPPAPSPEPALTHVDESGRARMVDVGSKEETHRTAVARGVIFMKRQTLELIKTNGFEKGHVLGVARIAGVMAAKSTAQLIPLCHPIPLDQVTLEFELIDDIAAVGIEATAKTTAKTGVEMEALTAVSVAALTIYDMCKRVDRGMRIDSVRLARKTGGRSGDIVLEE